MNELNNKLLFTEEEVSQITGFPRGSLRNARIAGRKTQGPPWVKIMGRVFYPADLLRRWVENLKPSGGEVRNNSTLSEAEGKEQLAVRAEVVGDERTK